jgi:hypothetical protein
MLGHVVNDFLNRYVDIVFYDALVNIPNDALDDAELLKQLAARVQNLLREHVLFAVDPQVRESLLSGVEDFSEVAQRTLLVENFVGFRKLLSVVPGGAASLVDLAEPFHLVKEPFASSLTVLRVKIVLFIWPLLQMIAHHNCVFEQ